MRAADVCLAAGRWRKSLLLEIGTGGSIVAIPGSISIHLGDCFDRGDCPIMGLGSFGTLAF